VTYQVTYEAEYDSYMSQAFHEEAPDTLQFMGETQRPIIHFVRHGQSEFNRIWALTGRDPQIRDAPLSALGHAQVEAASPMALALRPDLIITSPLTRAIQTTLGLFGTDVAPIVVDAIHAERITNTDDVGSAPGDLANRFSALDFSELRDPWWPTGPLDELGVPLESDESFEGRVAEFCRSLTLRPQARIVVVGHGNFFGALLGRHLDNCEIAPYTAAC
jgi:glucosyl-3-phosphoglycerate phosphatase